MYPVQNCHFVEPCTHLSPFPFSLSKQHAFPPLHLPTTEPEPLSSSSSSPFPFPSITRNHKMEQEPGLSRPESIVGLASHHLSLRDLSAAKKYASLAQQSHPNRPEPAQIIAIADVHLAAANRLPKKRIDWYAILQLQKTGPDCPSRSEIRTRFKYLLTLLNPERNRFPLSYEAFTLVCDAWGVLSNPVKKTQFDNEIAEIAGSSFDLENVKKSATFWTVCPYCYCMHQYDGVYEGCCLRCQNCRRGFHGVAVAAPGENVVVEGKDQYYCGIGFFPLKYCLGGKESFQGGKEEDKDGCSSEKRGFKESLVDKDGCFNEKNGFKEGLDDKDGCFSEKKGLKEGLVDVVEISDDSDGENVNQGMGKESSAVEVEAGKENVSIGDQPSDHVEKLAPRRKKIIARCMKKRLGTGRKGMDIEEGDQSLGMEGTSGSDEDEPFDDDELEFSFGEDDIYIGFKNGFRGTE